MRRMTIRVGATLAAGVMVSVLLGSAIAGAAPITKEQFIQKGDAICTAGSTVTDKQIAKRFPNLATSSKLPSKADQKKIAAIIVAGVTSDITKLKKLGTPKGDEKQVNAIYAAVKKEIAAVKKDPGTVFSNSSPLNGSSALAAAYGFQKCGQG